MKTDSQTLEQRISALNWKISGYVDAGGGIIELEKWVEALTKDSAKGHSDQRLDRRSTVINADTAGGVLDNLEQLPTSERARALMTMLRNIVCQADNDGPLTPDEIYSHIQTVGRDHNCP